MFQLALEGIDQYSTDYDYLKSSVKESEEYLSRQIITYIGNKRSLLPRIDECVKLVRKHSGGKKLKTLDVFSGSGIVSRLLKQHSYKIIANDLEDYSRIVNECYLSNRIPSIRKELNDIVVSLNKGYYKNSNNDGFIGRLYAPKEGTDIKKGERVFYTPDNAARLDYFTQQIKQYFYEYENYLMGPLLSKASVHANTGGVFKGFYKDKNTGIGKFGASGGDALKRILAPIELEVPVYSRFESDYEVYCQDANSLVGEIESVDLAYFDPPYNQHPYGSNYFMLNLIANYREPKDISVVSGIPSDWNRSGYNVKRQSYDLFSSLLNDTPARFLLISFNSEGYIEIGKLIALLRKLGSLTTIEINYNTYRASRNLNNRSLYVNEYLFLVDRAGEI